MSRLESLKQMLADEPHDSFLRYGYACELVKSGNVNEGLAEFDVVIQNDSDYVPAYFRKAQVLAEQGQSDQARETAILGVQVAVKTGDHHAAGEMRAFIDLL